jgi:RNA polymerase subunit RPABC4/transcription elongation factor Spt4
MEITSILIGLVLLAASLFFISMPFRKKQQKDVKNSKTNLQVQKERREMVVAALRDLDFDFKTGKVSEEDYTPLRARLMAEAAQYIERQQEEDQKLEALIQSRRAAHQQGINCDHCGAHVGADQRFCSKCGLPVKNELCSSCGRKIQSNEQFCPSCGNRREVKMEAAVLS